MENCGEIITARYHLENLEKRRDVLEKEIQPLKDSVVHIRNVQKTIREKDRQAEQKTARLRKELGGSFRYGAAARRRFRQR